MAEPLLLDVTTVPVGLPYLPMRQDDTKVEPAGCTQVWGVYGGFDWFTGEAIVREERGSITPSFTSLSRRAALITASTIEGILIFESLVDFEVDPVEIYAKEHNMSLEEAATKLVASDTELVSSIQEGDASLRSGGCLLSVDEVFGSSQ